MFLPEKDLKEIHWFFRGKVLFTLIEFTKGIPGVVYWSFLISGLFSSLTLRSGTGLSEK